MIDLKIFPNCCPTRHYVLLGLIRLDSNAIWELYECQECGKVVKKYLRFFENIEEI